MYVIPAEKQQYIRVYETFKSLAQTDSLFFTWLYIGFHLSSTNITCTNSSSYLPDCSTSDGDEWIIEGNLFLMMQLGYLFSFVFFILFI